MSALVQPASATTVPETQVVSDSKQNSQEEATPLKSLVQTKTEVLRLQAKITPFVVKFMKKLGGSFDEATRINVPNGESLSFHGEETREDGNVMYEFIVGANTRLKLPLSFIHMILKETVTDKYMELFIREWSVNLDGQEIPMIAWIDENSGETLARVLTQAQKRTQKALQQGKRSNPVDDFQIRSVRQFINILTGKPHDDPASSDVNPTIQKRRLHISQISKRPTIVISSRNMS